MQDPSSTTLFAQLEQQTQFPEQEQLRCPRCDSTNTKFCYYNNYNLSQPRHFCKSCRRYWTKGGTLRNIPVGGGTRKITAKRSSSSSSSSSSSASVKRPASSDHDPKAQPAGSGTLTELPNVVGGFTSLLGTSNGQYGNLVDGFGSGSGLGLNLLPLGDQSLESGACWGNGGDDLGIFTSTSTF